MIIYNKIILDIPDNDIESYWRHILESDVTIIFSGIDDIAPDDGLIIYGTIFFQSCIHPEKRFFGTKKVRQIKISTHDRHKELLYVYDPDYDYKDCNSMWNIMDILADSYNNGLVNVHHNAHCTLNLIIIFSIFNELTDSVIAIVPEIIDKILMELIRELEYRNKIDDADRTIIKNKCVEFFECLIWLNKKCQMQEIEEI